MWYIKVFQGFCFIACLVIPEIELTPIVTLPPEGIPIPSDTTGATEIMAVSPTTETSKFLVSKIFSSHVSKGTTETTSINEVTTLGQDETSVTTELPVTGNNSNSHLESTTVVVQKTVQNTEASTETYLEEVHEATVPQLIMKIESSTLPMSNNDTFVTEVVVTSKPLRMAEQHVLKQENKNISNDFNGNDMISSTNNPIKINNTGKNGTDEMEGNYKDKAPLEYHPYIEEILNFGENDSNGTASLTVPIRIKPQGYHSSQNALFPSHPYGPLAKFDEKEMGKLRLNHWRVRQILKEHPSPSTHVDLHPGQSGTDKGSTSDNPFLFGQKRASSSSAEAAASSTVRSSFDQDEFHTSVTIASDDEAASNENAERPCPPSKLRSFFNWISNPLKNRKPSQEDQRLKQARAQQPILPFALGYRGDFLFW